MLKSLKKFKVVIVILLIIVLLSCVYFNIVKTVSSKVKDVCVLLDAGHGGRDGGCVGINGSVEKDLNLKYTLQLKNKLVKYGYKVVLTRKDDTGLYNPFASNKKVSDMNVRMKKIKEANPNLVVSIHMNSFTDKTVSGANCFYKIDDEASVNCANLIQKALNEYCGVKSDTAKKGDYFMLNCSYYTSVLIECGFLSNPQEEAKIRDSQYQKELCAVIGATVSTFL